jgi:multicomponent K+:H+ antiporter subunit E
MLRKVLPAPLLSLVLWILWSVLNSSWSPGHLALGLGIAVAVPSFTGGLWPEKPRLKKPWVLLRLVLTVLWDVVVSNIEVARRILGPESHIKPAFVWVSLSIQDPHGMVALACIITMTPGTLSADLSDDRRHLLVHAFNVIDAAALIDSIKTRYERPLMEVFE